MKKSGKREAEGTAGDDARSKKKPSTGTARKPRLLPGFTTDTHLALEVKTLKKTLKDHVKSVAHMVDRDWHDGFEEQDEEIWEWYKSLEEPLNAISSVAKAGTDAKGYDRLNQALLIMADSWEDMNAIPKRGGIGDCIYDADSDEKVKIGRVSPTGPGEAFHWVWRLVLLSMCSHGMADDQIYRVIKDAHDYGWRPGQEVEDEDDSDDGDAEPTKSESGGAGAAALDRLTRLYTEGKTTWEGLKTNFKVHRMRRAIDRRFDGPKHLRTRHFSDDEDSDEDGFYLGW